jgi:hypothetical protein
VGHRLDAERGAGGAHLTAFGSDRQPPVQLLIAGGPAAATGGRARAENFQERRQAAERAVDAQLVAGLEKALKRLEAMVDSENQQVAFRAVALYLDRALGKVALPAQAGGRHDVSRSERSRSSGRSTP